MFGIFFIVITVLCSIPLIISLLYFIMGAKSFIIGKKEGNRNKTSGGIKTMIISLMGLFGSVILWYWLLR